MKIERFLIKHCAPTLAGVKSGNLFSVDTTLETALALIIFECSKLVRR